MGASIDGKGIDTERVSDLRATRGHLDEKRGQLLVPASGATISDDDVRSLRDADQK
jgi:hypothetical protein